MTKSQTKTWNTILPGSWACVLLIICFFWITDGVVIAGETINGSIMHDGIQRDYILYIPASYSGDVSVPLVFNFHGYTCTAFDQMYYGDFRPIADTANFIIVHPQGTLLDNKTHWNVGGWTSGSTTDDIGFTSALIDSIASEYNIDLTRVYATGMSNGGFMSFLLACQLGGKIAAIASVTGSMTPETYDECSPVHPTAILQIHGTNDSVVPYTGNSWAKTIDDVLQYWIISNNCSPTATTTTMPDIDPTDGSTVEHIVYDGGDNGVSVEHFKVIGGEHTWPGSAFGSVGTNHDIDASAEIWNFFSKYDINGLITTPGIGIDLTLSQDIFQFGDEFILSALITNPGPILVDQPFVVLLDVFGSYFWYPSWSNEFECDLIHVGIGESQQNILNFSWPEIEGTGNGIRFYSALLTSNYSAILGSYDMQEFGWN
ncbi:hypothetical protein K8T06_18065 [bacterium]|nr:hypothetical protein [bacterium]